MLPAPITTTRLPARPSAAAANLQGPRSLYSEQLVYVAAFAVGADLLFGDRPKQITYSRMLYMPSLGAVQCSVQGGVP